LNKITFDTEGLKKLFEELSSSTDPKIKIDKNIIEIIPYYWNYSFITNFPLIPISIYIFFSSTEFEPKALSVLGFAILIFNIFYQLSYTNKSIIEFQNKTITIIPNIVTKLYSQKKTIGLMSVKKIEAVENGLWYANKRYIVKGTTYKNTSFNIINVEKKETAEELVFILMQFI
jgi:hypothetical protein